MGYVNAMIERMDRADILKKVESFQIETASRKTFRQLTEHYSKLDSENKQRAEKISNVADMAKKRTETQEQMIKKLQQSVLEIANLNKRLQVLVSLSFFIKTVLMMPFCDAFCQMSVLRTKNLSRSTVTTRKSSRLRLRRSIRPRSTSSRRSMPLWPSRRSSIRTRRT